MCSPPSSLQIDEEVFLYDKAKHPRDLGVGTVGGGCHESWSGYMAIVILGQAGEPGEKLI